MASNSVVIELEIRNRQARAALEGIESGFTSLRKSTDKTTTIAQKGTNAVGKSVSKTDTQFKHLNSTIGAFGYAIQDAPFALITGNFASIGNNLPQIIQGVNNLGSESDTLYDKLKLLAGNAFKGPLGLITVANLATAAITILGSGLIDFGSDAEETEEKFKVLNQAIDDYINTASELQGRAVFDPLGQVTTEQSINQVVELKSELQTLFDLRSEAERLQELIKGISGPVGLAVPAMEQRNRLTEVNDAIREQERLFGELSKTEEEVIQKRLEDLQATSKMNQAMLRLNPALQFQVTLNKQLSPVLRDVELGLSNSEGYLNNLITAYQAQADAIRESIETGDAQGKELEELKNILFSLTNAIDKAKKAQDGLNESQKKAKLTREQVQNFGWMQEAIVTQQRRQSFQLAGLGGTLEDPRTQAQRPQDQIIKPDMFKIPQSEVDKQLQQQREMIGGWNEMGDAATKAGDKGQKSLQATSNAANMLGNALAQAVVRGEKLEGVLMSLAAQLASRALINGLGMLLTGGSFSIGSLLFGGFAQGTDGGFPGMGMVGERGRELLVAPPFSSIITNENVEKMDRMRREAREGAHGIMSLQGGQIQQEIRTGIRQGLAEATVIAQMQDSIADLDDKLRNHREKQQIVGN